jgi:hypothetical protein
VTRCSRFLRPLLTGVLAIGFVGACGPYISFRNYLNAGFWRPFFKRAVDLEKPNLVRLDSAYAGMGDAKAGSSIARMRTAYQDPASRLDRQAPVDGLLAATRADRSLSAREHEEAELIAAKFAMRDAERGHERGDDARLRPGLAQMEAFLTTAKVPEFQSEARGWVAHIHYLLGNLTVAGKLYLDELNRPDSNLSRDTILNSIGFIYGSNGGRELPEHLDQYFDTAEHAAFAIQTVTNSGYEYDAFDPQPPRPEDPTPFRRILELLRTHRSLFAAESGAKALTLLTMRTALRMGDPSAVLETASMVPANSPIRREPDFLWLQGSSYFLTRQYSAAERPLLRLVNSSFATVDQRSNAATGLIGVYGKLKNPVEQVRFAHWRTEQGAAARQIAPYWFFPDDDIDLLLDVEVPDEALETFLTKYPRSAGVTLVRYSLAVRRARENRYQEAAELYRSVQVNHRAARMDKLAALYSEVTRGGVQPAGLAPAKFALAEYLAANPERLYFNDRLWFGLQTYMLGKYDGLTRAERDALITKERKLRDDQEERWRAYQLLEEVVRDAPDLELRRRAATLAIATLRRINTQRFGRADEIHAADIRLSIWLKRNRKG